MSKKIQMGQILDFRQNFFFWNPNISVRISDTFFWNASNDLLSSTYSVEAKCGSVKTKPKKPVASHLEANGTCSNIRISNPNMLKSDHFECVPKIPNVRNPNVLKSELAFVRISALSEIRTFGFQTFTVLYKLDKSKELFRVAFWWYVNSHGIQHDVQSNGNCSMVHLNRQDFLL